MTILFNFIDLIVFKFVKVDGFVTRTNMPPKKVNFMNIKANLLMCLFTLMFLKRIMMLSLRFDVIRKHCFYFDQVLK